MATPQVLEFKKTDSLASVFKQVGHEPLFCVMGASRLNSTHLVDQAQMHARLSGLCQELSAAAATAENIGSELDHMCATGKDAHTWLPAMYGPHATFGVANASPSGLPEYYAVVKTEGGPGVDKLRRFIAQNKTMPLGDMLSTPLYHAAESFSRRNAARLAAFVGSALVKNRAQHASYVMRVENDISGTQPAADDYLRSQLAQFDYATQHNTFAPHPSDQNAVLFYKNCGTSLPSQSGEPGQLVHCDHLKGFAFYSAGGAASNKQHMFDVMYHTEKAGSPQFRQAQKTAADKFIASVFMHSGNGASATSDAETLWQVSDTQVDRATAATRLMKPVAMVVQDPKK
jgi:hypothetical protein